MKRCAAIRQLCRQVVLCGAVAFAPAAFAATLEVGPGKPFARIEEANAKARPGDTVLVYPRENGQPYQRTAVYVRQKQVTFRGVPEEGRRWVKISGKGFDYSGSGSTPRAIFQFNAGTDGCMLEGLELCEAHNQSHNGAGVRINQANRVRVRNCSIHNNDMGIMSNGNGTLQAAVDQRIEHCEIHHNGDPADPGYNHNLYLGGTSVTLRFCEIHSSLTGHNVKSRAHHTQVEYCYIHHSANREFDLVDAPETAQPESNAVLVGSIIVKDPQCRGNRGVIHFGQDGGKGREGMLTLSFNTIVTPFISPVVDLSTPHVAAQFWGNIICDGGAKQAGQVIAAARSGAPGIGGMHNWFSGAFGGQASVLQAKEYENVFRRYAGPMFVNPAQDDYHLTPAAAKLAAISLTTIEGKSPLPPGMDEKDALKPLGWQYRHPAGKERRPVEKRLTMGAYAAKPE